MFKRNKSILCLLIAILMMVSESTSAIAASPHETRYNNTVLASSVASISENGLLTVDNQFLGIRGKTTKGEIATYIDKRILGLFWTRVDIGQPNNQWRDVVYDYIYNGTHTFQLSSHGTYRITVTYVISGSGGEADTITQTITKTY